MERRRNSSMRLEEGRNRESIKKRGKEEGRKEGNSSRIPRKRGTKGA